MVGKLFGKAIYTQSLVPRPRQTQRSLVNGRLVSPAHRGWWAEHGRAQVPSRGPLSSGGNQGGGQLGSNVPGIVIVCKQSFLAQASLVPAVAI